MFFKVKRQADLNTGSLSLFSQLQLNIDFLLCLNSAIDREKVPRCSIFKLLFILLNFNLRFMSIYLVTMTMIKDISNDEKGLHFLVSQNIFYLVRLDLERDVCYIVNVAII